MTCFQISLEDEAEIYCSSSKLGLTVDPQVDSVINHLTQVFIEERKINMTINEASEFIVTLCKDNVLNQINNREDKNGVAWTMALLIKAYISACTNPYDYDIIFKLCFIKYYED